MSENSRLDWSDIKKSAAKFVLRFKDVKKEASYKQIFWSEFLKMFGVDVMQVGAFEYYVKKLGSHAGEIDFFWPGKVIIEHKSTGKDLDAAMDQAMDYLLGIKKKEEWPRYIIVSDFKRIRLMDLVERRDTTIFLRDLPDNIEMFGFLAGYSDKRIEGQHPVNIKAAEVMGELYDILKESGYPENDLDLLLIRIVFCMFAEDADIFEKNLFSSYLSFHTGEDGSGMGATISEIFAVMNTPYEERQSTMSAELQKFPYVNGGLFAETLTTPMFDRNMREHFFKASKLDWKYISPAIFGSLFQSIMDPQKRRELGAHYTSEENILKAINPLFMDDLRTEFNSIRGNPKELRKFWDKLSDIKILDPACGCGNFLIISYREMRRLEMDVLDAIYKGQMILDESHLFIDHYYGMEIGEFASMVANLSMILMDHLMNMEMRNRFGICRDIIPLKEKANIVCTNSLTTDWNQLVKSSELSYIVGNPPFVGARQMTDLQKEDMSQVFDRSIKFGNLDYVTAWYQKAAEYCQNTRIHVAFVSTNSICEGEQPGILWKYLFKKGIIINFAHTTFKWMNEARGVAAVHCVIIGFSYIDDGICTIFSESGKRNCRHINAYLLPAPDIFIENRSKPLDPVNEINYGSFALDDGNYTISEKEYHEIVNVDSCCAKYLRMFLGANEFLKGKKRYCLWLADAKPSDLVQSPIIRKKVDAVRTWRLSRSRKETQDLAKTPTLFAEVRQPDTDYLAIPTICSEKRDYIPMGFLTKEVIASNQLYILPNASLYDFGILTSRTHMIWMRAVSGKLETRYRYSSSIVYNNYPWPEIDEERRVKIEKLAKNVLDIREKYRDMSFANLYDPISMPAELAKAHQKLDQEVEKAYGFVDNSTETCLEGLFMLYLKKITG